MIDVTGLAFPVARVKYAGPTNTRGGRWIAQIKRGDRTWRSTVPYDHALSSGATNAAVAARQAYEQMRADYDVFEDVSQIVVIPGDLDSDTYVFTFVPIGILERS